MEVQEWLGKQNNLGIDIWEKKYQYDKESFDSWLNRVSGNTPEVQELIVNKKFLFGGRILSNRGLQHQGKKVSLSNCYVMAPPEDNIEHIFETAAKLARTYSYGGGCGVDISKLAPRGAKINNAAKETSGSVSFMNLYSLVTELIGQNGRRGALMISIECSHPDIEDFINIKTDLDKITKANISIRITDEFMKAVKDGTDYTLHFTRETTGEKIIKNVSARELFSKIAHTNWDYAEPGALFWDRIKNWNLLSNDEDFEYAGVNPCAEEPLPAGGSCLLGSINLSAFVKKPFTSEAKFDLEDFKNTVRISVRALNDVLDEGLPLHPLEEQRESVKNWRQVGLGVMGIADTLIKLGITYGSGEAVSLSDKIGFTMADQAIAESARLAKKYGTYPKCNKEAIIETPYFQYNTSPDTFEMVKKYGLRNSQLLTIAPTGTLSTMLGISGGIEPVYANYYERKTESLHGKDVYYKVYTPIVEKYIAEQNLADESELPDYFVTAMTLDYKSRIHMQSVWQTHIDASISSTINVPETFTEQDTQALYLYAYEAGLKGVTIYRDGCKRSGILSENARNKAKPGKNLNRGDIIQIADSVIGKKRKLVTGCGNLHCIAMFDCNTGDLLEVYLSKGSQGGCNNFMIGLSRMISISARGGVDIYTIIDQLNSTGSCPSYTVRYATRKDTSKGSCCPMAVGNALLSMYNEVQEELKVKQADNKSGDGDERFVQEATNVGPEMIDSAQINNPCPMCGEELVFEGGCNTCKACGWSKCF